jgi:hypothetical protein
MVASYVACDLLVDGFNPTHREKMDKAVSQKSKAQSADESESIWGEER